MPSNMQRALSFVRRAVDDYKMIEEGDRIAVGVSGGKDSLALLCTLSSLKRFYPKKFELSAITIDMGYDSMSFEGVARLCESLGVDYFVKKTAIREVIFDIRKEKNPCSLCANMRRGALNAYADELGSNKVALAHHFDDAIETFFMNLLYEGRVGCFSPVTKLERSGITVIRPMIYMPENFVRCLTKELRLPIVKNPCPADGHTRREYVKNLLYDLDKDSPGLKKRLFTALRGSDIDSWGI